MNSSTATLTANPTTESQRVQLGLSVVVPMYNEAEGVAIIMANLRRLAHNLADELTLDFVLVDDGSADETAALVIAEIEGDERFRLIQHGVNRGVAAAIFTGIRHAAQPLVASIDADGSYDPTLLAEMAPLVTGEIKMVTASPYHPLGAVENVPAWRIRLSKLASQLYAVVMPQRLNCYTCCFRVYDRAAILACEPRQGGFVGVAELLWNLQRRGGCVVEHPAVLRPRQFGFSKMRFARTTMAHLRLLARIPSQRLFDNVKRSLAAKR